MVSFFLSLLRDAAAEWAGAQRRTLFYARLLAPDARAPRSIGDGARYTPRLGGRSLADGTSRSVAGRRDDLLVPLGVDALTALVALYFFVVGIADGSVSCFNGHVTPIADADGARAASTPRTGGI
jgi:hypothetical protein